MCVNLSSNIINETCVCFPPCLLRFFFLIGWHESWSNGSLWCDEELAVHKMKVVASSFYPCLFSFFLFFVFLPSSFSPSPSLFFPFSVSDARTALRKGVTASLILAFAYVRAVFMSAVLCTVSVCFVSQFCLPGIIKHSNSWGMLRLWFLNVLILRRSMLDWAHWSYSITGNEGYLVAMKSQNRQEFLESNFYNPRPITRIERIFWVCSISQKPTPYK